VHSAHKRSYENRNKNKREIYKWLKDFKEVNIMLFMNRMKMDFYCFLSFNQRMCSGWKNIGGGISEHSSHDRELFGGFREGENIYFKKDKRKR
jgi:hypothetical protein